MPVAREIQVAIRAERGKHLVAGRVDWRPQILQTVQSVGRNLHTPDIIATQSTGHVADKIEPHAIGRYGRMRKRR